MKQRIKVDDKNIGELFVLPCVTAIIKGWKNGNVILQLDNKISFDRFARQGDWLVEQDSGMWRVEKVSKQVR